MARNHAHDVPEAGCFLNTGGTRVGDALVSEYIASNADDDGERTDRRVL